jgi:uncharacterized membrane protein
MNNSSISTKKVVLNGVMIALVFLATKLTGISLGGVYFNIGDVAIMVSAILLGKNTGFLAGSIGSALSDLLSGAYSFYAPITFIVKGLEGYFIGMIAFSADKSKKGEFLRILAVTVGAAIMVGGYFLADTFVLGLMGKEYGLVTAFANAPFNLVQGIISIVLGYALTTMLSRTNIKKDLS